MKKMQQYTCPECGVIGAHPTTLPAPFCHVCVSRIKMKPSHNGRIIKDKCKGLCFRAHLNQYLSEYNSIEVRKSLRLLKRKSCKGCEDCYNLLELIKEEIQNDSYTDILSKIEDGKMYQITTIWHSGTYEYPDDGYNEIYFIEVNDEK